MDLFGADTGTASMVLVLLILNLIKGEQRPVRGVRRAASTPAGTPVVRVTCCLSQKHALQFGLMVRFMCCSVLHPLRLLRQRAAAPASGIRGQIRARNCVQRQERTCQPDTLPGMYGE